MYNINNIFDSNRMLYKYIRGSHCHGINTPTSDIDIGGVFIDDFEVIGGLDYFKQEQVADNKNDTVIYEVGKFMSLILKANPTILEALYVDKQFIQYIHPSFQRVIDSRDMFITKECFNSFFGYASSQIQKARGLNKKIVKPVHSRKTPLDFCYTFTADGSGSIPLTKFMEINGLKQEHFGLVNIPNMLGIYSAYYDATGTNNYCGIIGDNSDEIRLQSIPKGEQPICYISYNKDGYSEHCKDYAAYKKWEKERNPIRYESNLNKNYDSKNMCECFRLINMAIEIAQGHGVIVNRKGIDDQLLLDIKAHKYEYDELMKMLSEQQRIMVESAKTADLPERIDINVVNKLLIDIRKDWI